MIALKVSKPNSIRRDWNYPWNPLKYPMLVETLPSWMFDDIYLKHDIEMSAIKQEQRSSMSSEIIIVKNMSQDENLHIFCWQKAHKDYLIRVFMGEMERREF